MGILLGTHLSAQLNVYAQFLCCYALSIVKVIFADVQTCTGRLYGSGHRDVHYHDVILSEHSQLTSFLQALAQLRTLQRRYQPA